MSDKIPETKELRCPSCKSTIVVYRQREGNNICRRCGQVFLYVREETEDKTLNPRAEVKAKPKAKPKSKAKKSK